MSRPRKKKSDALREMVRAELSAAVAGFREEVKELTDAARHLNDKLFDLGVHQGNIRDALRQSETALKVSAELRHEWGEAKVLAKVFEQRQFLRSLEVQEARRLIAKAAELRAIGAGAMPGPDLPGKTVGERAASLLVKVETARELQSGAVEGTDA